MEYLSNKEIQEIKSLLESKREFRRLNNFEYRNNEGVLMTEEEINEQEWLDNVQTVLDYAGVVPVYGDAIDLINAVIYFTRAGVDGKFMPNGMNGLFSIIAVIPVVGSALAIPLRTAFKMLPVPYVTKIVKELFEGSGEKAAKEMMEGATEGQSKKALNDLQNYIIKNLDKILKGTKAVKRTLGALAVIPFTKVDDKLAAAGIAIVVRLEKFLKTLGKKGAADVAGDSVKGLIVKSIPTNQITKRGRIAATRFKLALPGAKRVFYASQDMFMDYLLKEGRGKLTKEMGSNLMNQTVRNLNGGKALSGETIEQFMKRVGEDKFAREFTNLSIVNDSKLFQDFIGSQSANQRYQRIMKSFDPSIIKDANNFWGSVKKIGWKSTLNLFKGKTSEEEYRRNKEVDREQDRIDKNRGNNSHSKTGKRRNV